MDHKLTWEVHSLSEPDADGDVTVNVKPVPCGPDCGVACDCSSAMFGNIGPFQLRINGRKRLTFLGNLGQLLKEFEAMQSRIARMQCGPTDVACDRSDSGSGEMKGGVSP